MMPTRLTASCAADLAATSQSPSMAATTAKPAAGTVVTEMKTPTSAADFDDTSDSMPAAPASSATTNDSGPTWKMKSTSLTCLTLLQAQPADGLAGQRGHRGDAHRDREADQQGEQRRVGPGRNRRCTSATERAASGPNSGPSTMAPTTVTVESVTTPIAAIRQARRQEQQERHRQGGLLAGARDQFVPDHRVGGVALGLVLGLVRPRRQHRVEGVQRDRAAVLHVERLQFLDHVVGALAGDVGGDLVARRFQRGPRIQQHVRDAHLATQDVDDRIPQFFGSDHPQVQHDRRVSADNRLRGHLGGCRPHRR